MLKEERAELGGIWMEPGMRGKSLPLDGASEVVLSLEDEGFLLRCLDLGGLASKEGLLAGKSGLSL